MNSNTIDPRTPVLIGCSQITDTESQPSSKRSPSAFVAEAVRLALADAQPAGGAQSLADRLESIAVLRYFSDSSPRFVQPHGRSSNPPKTIARLLGASALREFVYTEVGGNMPQYLLNESAERIARGEIDATLVCGGELLRSAQIAQRQGLTLDWSDDPGGEPASKGDQRLGWSEEEARHGLRAAIWMYPLLENAVRGDRGATPQEHLQSMAKLFARFAAVARDNPLATRREGYDAQTLAHIDANNRYISWPYPRLMNSNAFVDQSSAVIMVSTMLADELGVPHHRRVYLRGCADAADIWTVSERAELHRSPAIRGCSKLALSMAGISLDEIAAFDIYSCFPSAVEVGCREIGLAEDDPRGLTVTGGLPYFGGPGNNYVTHSIAQMMDTVRARPGSYGMVTANGSYLTKHSTGIYSTVPGNDPWEREDPGRLQAEIDAGPSVRVETAPQGSAHIETYTITYAGEKPSGGIIFGRLPDGARFVSTVPTEPTLLARMVAEDQLGRPGTVQATPTGNVFTPACAA